MRKTSWEWQQLCHIEVLDPDGWDRQNLQFSWYEELITREEFEKRLVPSTIQFDREHLANIWRDRTESVKMVGDKRTNAGKDMKQILNQIDEVLAIHRIMLDVIVSPKIIISGRPSEIDLEHAITPGIDEIIQNQKDLGPKL